MKETKTRHDITELTGNSNRTKVLQLIRNSSEITRAEIIQKSGLSAPTITRIVESLTQLHLVDAEGTGSSIGGRPPQIVRFNSKENYVIGIDLGATFIRAALSNLDGEFIFEIHVPTNLKGGFDKVMSQTGNLVQKLNERAAQKKLRLWGVGIAVCGMVNKNSCIVEYSPIFNWKNVDIKLAISKYTNLKIVLGNVVNLIALGELLYGVGKNYSNFICLNLGYGIGSGIIAERKLFTGSYGIAGEVGHIVIDRNSKRKGMEGVAGTMEALASGYAIADIARESARLDKKSFLYTLEPKDIDAKCVFDAALNGDRLAGEIISSVAANLSIGIDTLIKLFNPECIVLSGGLTKNGEILLKKIKSELKFHSMHAISRSVPVVLSSFGDEAGLMGSFSLILEKILSLDQNSLEVF